MTEIIEQHKIFMRLLQFGRQVLRFLESERESVIRERTHVGDIIPMALAKECNPNLIAARLRWGAECNDIPTPEQEQHSTMVPGQSLG